jgi:hypothetical protein
MKRILIMSVLGLLACDSGANPAPGSSKPAPGSSNPGTGSPGDNQNNNQPNPNPPSGKSAEDICFDTINAYRKTLNLPPYQRWSDAERCVSAQAESDSKTDQAHGAFGQCGEYGQNECPGWPGPSEAMIRDCLQRMWDEGPGGGHYENMRSSHTKAACGFHTLPDGSVWAVQDFGD